MKSNRAVLISLILLVIIASIYRIVPGRPYGFAPQIAMSLFAGAVIKDRKWALILPILSLFLSDLIFEVLYKAGLTDLWGFYEGQWQNYLLFVSMVVIGFLIKKINVINILAASVAAPFAYFLASNFIVWAGWQGTRGLNRPKTLDGLMLCYADGLPFFFMSVYATIFFSAVLFGTYYFINKKSFSFKTA